MRVPDALLPLLDAGVIHDVIRPLMSGKEADVYLVDVDGETMVAKTYKEAHRRSFKHRADYIEGRKVKNSRSRRAMAKRSRFGRAQIEAAWRATEVDVIFKLADAGVRVPRPHAFVDGVLVMELIRGADGGPAPRLVDHTFRPAEAWSLFQVLIGEVVKMLCAGVVHGDLSDFNVLLAHDGPVIIDFPQAVDPAHNRNARRLLIRDVKNLSFFLGRYTRKLRGKRFGDEIWALYEAGELRPDTPLTGKPPARSTPKNEAPLSLLEELEAIAAENRRKRQELGLKPRRPARTPAVALPAASQPRRPKRRRKRKKRSPSHELDVFLSES